VLRDLRRRSTGPIRSAPDLAVYSDCTDARLYDHRSVYSHSRGRPCRSRDAGMNIVAQASWKLWDGNRWDEHALSSHRSSDPLAATSLRVVGPKSLRISTTISVDGRVGAQISKYQPSTRRAEAWRGFPAGCIEICFFAPHRESSVVVWDQPYLETCCRSALHRLHLGGRAGRPPDSLDGKCLLRIAAMGLCDQRPDERFVINAAGVRRHAAEVLQRPSANPMAQ
jgi:hypothetical protein